MTAQTSEEPFDILGSKVLIGVQIIDLSRLSTHPVPMVSEGLVTVAGQGPTDSNGAGKSSWIAALSLLHADEQWRLSSGAPGAAELLFTAEAAGQEGKWSSVDHGYVVGVFAAAGAADLQQIEDSATTVWLRINRKASYLDLRWKAGLYVPYGATESERAAGANALWEALPTSNGRTDFHANKLSAVLYGGHVRCVSFLSTSVRSSPTANLLAEPLNELGPGRIFNAIATLTGLDRELEQEQAHRSVEHAQREATKQATDDLQQWEQDMATVEAAIGNRAAARDSLGAARQSWQSRCARHLVDAVQRNDDIARELATLEQRAPDLRAQLTEVAEQIAQLGSDEALHELARSTRADYERLEQKDRNLDLQQRTASTTVEGLTRRHRLLLERGRLADGRDAQTAADELDTAQATLEEQIGRDHAARSAVETARTELEEAQSGQTIATSQRQQLDAGGIACAALTDIIDLADSRRDQWEARLTPYLEAVVIDADDHAEASKLLTGSDNAGTLLVLANRGHRNADAGDAGDVGGMGATSTGSGVLPVSSDDRFGLDAFFTALSTRSSDELIDQAAGVVAIGGYEQPVTGRAGRIVAAQAKLTACERVAGDEGRALTNARQRVNQATQRAAAVAALEEAEQVHTEILDLRTASEQTQAARDQLAPQVQQARAAAEEAAAQQLLRDEKLKNLQATRKACDAALDQAAQRKIDLLSEQADLDVAKREAAWGDSPATANRHLLTLTEREQRRTAGEWNLECCSRVDDVVRSCFPPGRPHDEIPGELREILLGTDGWRVLPVQDRIELVPALLRALHTHLTQNEEYDRLQLHQISTQRTERTSALARAHEGLTEAENTARVHRASLADGIKARLRLVSAEFDRLDQHYGGYGAKLEFPEPDPPAEPDKPWRWSVVPKWRRTEGGPYSAFNVKGNTAQMDEKAVKLVCAAALAGGSDRPLMLILDELGRNLGSQHRREAVALFEQIGHDRNITVIGALQDDMERYALAASNLYVKLRRSSDAMPYNEAPVVLGNESNKDRVETLRQWMLSYRGHQPVLEPE